MKTLNRNQLFSIFGIVVIGVLLGALILTMDRGQRAEGGHAGHAEESGGDRHAHGEEKGGHHEHGHEEEEQAKGPHGGRLFTEGTTGIEVAMAEEGGEPRLRVYLFEQDRQLPPDAAKVSVMLTRPDGERQELAFSPAKDYLESQAPVAEPHVFQATVAAQTASASYRFTFQETEGTIAMSDEQARSAGVTVLTAGPARIDSSLTLPGEIRYDEDRTAHVVPRLAGVVESVRASLGQQVRKGQVLAVIASPGLAEQRSELLAAQKRLALAKTTYEREKTLWREKISAEQDYLQAEQAMQEAVIAVRNAQQKLQAVGAGTGDAGALHRYEIRAPFDGLVMEKHISLGEAVREDAAIFTISDLSTVWAEFAVPAKDLDAVRVNEKVSVKAAAFDAEATGKVAYVGSLLGEQTRTAKARVSLANPAAAWRPGLFVNVTIVPDQAAVPVAVSTDAIQTVNGKPSVFVAVPGGFLPLPVTLGRSDGRLVEVVRGLKAGAKYAGPGSFIVKSEQGKASAEHTH